MKITEKAKELGKLKTFIYDLDDRILDIGDALISARAVTHKVDINIHESLIRAIKCLGDAHDILSNITAFQGIKKH